MTIASRGREALCACVCLGRATGTVGRATWGKRACGWSDGEVHGERAAGEEVDA